MKRSPIVFVALAALLLAGFPVASRGQENLDAQTPAVAATSQEELVDLPLASHRDLVPLAPGNAQHAALDASCAPQNLSQPPCDGEKLAWKRTPAQRNAQLRKMLVNLQKDKKHGVRVYFADRSQKTGRVISSDEDSFRLQTAKSKPEITIAYQDVSWVYKEPNGGEKFGRMVALVVLAPVWLPVALLWLAAGGD